MSIGHGCWRGALVAVFVWSCSESRDGLMDGHGPPIQSSGAGGLAGRGSLDSNGFGGSAAGGQLGAGGSGDAGAPNPSAGGKSQTSGGGGVAGSAATSGLSGADTGGRAAGGNVSSGGRGGVGSAAGGGPQGAASGNTAGADGGRGTCPGLPDVSDYDAKGPFDVKVISNAGPDGTYYLFRPDTTLGMGGFKHPIAVWGNGILTSPDQYKSLLGHLASHGIVVIACPSTQAERPCLDSGMDWLVKQNDDGPMKGKLDTSKEITIGYSWGGGAAIDTANRPQVKATISLHGMPPRENDAWNAMKSPLLLFTSTGDTFVDAKTYVTPNYQSSLVPTFYATLQEDVGHLYPIDENAAACVASVLLKGPCSGAVKERAPIVAWIRLWACADSAAKRYFYGPSCILCSSPWKSQSKPTGTFQ